jgi:hypothetical protein
MKSEDVELGMFVQVCRGFREADLRVRIGIVRKREPLTARGSVRECPVQAVEAAMGW